MSEAKKQITFVTYTKGAVQYVTIPAYESQFLDWLNSVDSSTGYLRETASTCGIRCYVAALHETTKREATVLTLIKRADS